MEKEEYRKAFNAGKEYWSWVQTDEPLLHNLPATLQAKEFNTMWELIQFMKDELQKRGMKILNMGSGGEKDISWIKWEESRQN